MSGSWTTVARGLVHIADEDFFKKSLKGTLYKNSGLLDFMILKLRIS